MTPTIIFIIGILILVAMMLYFYADNRKMEKELAARNAGCGACKEGTRIIARGCVVKTHGRADTLRGHGYRYCPNCGRKL